MTNEYFVPSKSHYKQLPVPDGALNFEWNLTFKFEDFLVDFDISNEKLIKIPKARATA